MYGECLQDLSQNDLWATKAKSNALKIETRQVIYHELQHIILYVTYLIMNRNLKNRNTWSLTGRRRSNGCLQAKEETWTKKKKAKEETKEKGYSRIQMNRFSLCTSRPNKMWQGLLSKYQKFIMSRLNCIFNLFNIGFVQF